MKKLYLVLAILVQVSLVYSQHFVKGYVGDGVEQMSILILKVEINGTPLQAGDEVAAYDGNLCVGVLVLDAEIDTAVFKPVLTVSADDDPDDNGYLNGFQDGRTIYLRFWDSSAGVEYHNVVPVFYDKTTGNPTTPSPFSKGGTSYVTASTENTTKTWTNSNDNKVWLSAENWEPIGIPEPFNDVVIPPLDINDSPNAPLIGTSENAYCGSLILNNTSAMVLNSSAAGTGSLIVAADVSGSGAVSSRRYLLANGWHMVSSPLSNQTIGAFLSANSGIPTKDVTSRGMMDYNEGTDDWSNYFTNSNSNNIVPGKGYSARRTTSGLVTFTGALNSGNVAATVTKGNFGWNLVGNPFTSAMMITQEVFGFLVVNSAVLDDSYEFVYLWDPTANSEAGAYSPVGIESGQPTLASGQGFFVKAASSGSVTFTQSMQVHDLGVPFKSATVSKPSIVLNAKASNISSSTKISFKEEMTLGLDPGYDAGILRSGNGFDIYTKLVNDNGVDFTIQALPGNPSDNYVIPVGVDASLGGEIVFSAQTMNLPGNYDLILEDKLTGAQTNMKNGELYVADIAANSKGVGRFYLHVGSSVQTGLEEIQQNDILVYTIDKTVFIKGTVSNNAQFMVYSVDGRLINRFGATSQNLNQMSVAGYSPGVYLLNVRDNNRYKSVKFVIGK